MAQSSPPRSPQARSRSSSKSRAKPAPSERTYKFFLALRLVATLASGYVHPDEHFQSCQVVASDILSTSRDITKPWEFLTDEPIRSSVGPYLLCGVPMVVLRPFVDVLNERVLSVLLLVLPRLWLFGLSVVLDEVVYSVADMCAVNLKHAERHRRALEAKTLHASLWTSIVLLVRPLSNTLEALFLAAFLVFFVRSLVERGAHVALSSIRLGFIVVIGVFVRPTFVAFILFPALDLLRRYIGARDTTRRATTTMLVLAGLAAFGSSLLIFMIDSTYYDQAVFTPYNFLRYNSDAANLAVHGTHNRLTHASVNMPLLFGILWPIYLIFGARAERSPVRSLVSSVIVSGVTILSLAPHQEPRFLLPLAAPLCVLTSRVIVDYPLLRPLVYVHTIGLTLFYGVLHQGGVSSALVNLSGGLPPSVTSEQLFAWKTYMPPDYLLVSESVRLHDAQGSCDKLCALLRKNAHTEPFALLAPLSALHARPCGQDGPSGDETTAATFGVNECGKCLDPSRLCVESVFRLHVSTENLPRSIDQVGLGLFVGSLEVA